MEGQELGPHLCLPLQQQHRAHLEEKLRLLATARDEAQSSCLQQQQKASQAQAQASQLNLQMDGLRRRLEELQQVGQGKGKGNGAASALPVPPQPYLHPLSPVPYPCSTCAQGGMTRCPCALPRRLPSPCPAPHRSCATRTKRRWPR